MKKLFLIFLILNALNLNCADDDNRNNHEKAIGNFGGGASLLGASFIWLLEALYHTQLIGDCNFESNYKVCSDLKVQRKVELTSGLLMGGIGLIIFCYAIKQLRTNNQAQQDDNDHQPDHA